MPDLFQKYTFGLLLTLLALLASSISIAQAKSGTFSSQTLTFADNATANLSVTVGEATPLLPPTTTRIRLQFLSDDVNSPLPPSVVTNVTFQLSNGIDPLPLSFTIADTGLDNSAKFPNKRIQFNVRDASKLLYDVEITHLALIGAGTTETWTLAIAGLPPSGGSPVLRVIAFLEQGSFSSLNPTGGACVAKQPCPAGQQCCGGNGDAGNCTGQCKSDCGVPCPTSRRFCCGGNGDASNCTGQCKSMGCRECPQSRPVCCEFDRYRNCTDCVLSSDECP